GKFDPVERIYRNDLYVVFGLPPGGGKNLIDQKWSGNHGRAGVEGEAVLLIDVRSATRLVASFKNGDFVPASLQTAGNSESAETATDDEDSFVLRRHANSRGFQKSGGCPLQNRPPGRGRRRGGVRTAGGAPSLRPIDRPPVGRHDRIPGRR